MKIEQKIPQDKNLQTSFFYSQSLQGKKIKRTKMLKTLKKRKSMFY